MKKDKNIHGFKTPPDYFENLEDAVFIKLAEENLPKQAGFTVPDAYFDSIEDRVSNALKAENRRNTKVISLLQQQRFLAFVAVAACILLIITIYKTPSPTNFDDIEASSIATYLEEGNLDLASADLIAQLDTETIDDLTFESIISSEEHIEEYLMDALDDNTLLIE